MKYEKRVAWLYILWSAVYLCYVIPYWHSIGFWSFGSVKDAVFALLFKGIYYHMWYLLCLFYALPLLYGLLTLVPLKVLFWLVPVLWLFNNLACGYSWLDIPGIRSLCAACDAVPALSQTLFWAIPLICVGGLISANMGGVQSGGALWAGLGLSGAALVAEASWLRFMTPNDGKYSYIVFTLPFAFFLFRLIAFSKSRKTSAERPVLRKCGTFVYCVHPLLLTLVSLVWIEAARPLLFFVVLSLSEVLGFTVVRLSDKVAFLKRLF